MWELLLVVEVEVRVRVWVRQPVEVQLRCLK